MIIKEDAYLQVITEETEQQIFQCAYEAQKRRQSLLYQITDKCTLDYCPEPQWDVELFEKYSALKKLFITPNEWNLLALFSLTNSRDWCLLLVPSDYYDLSQIINEYLENRSNSQMLISATHAIANYIEKRYIPQKNSKLINCNIGCKRNDIRSILYILAYLSDSSCALDCVCLLHVLIMDYVWRKTSPQLIADRNIRLPYNNTGLKITFSMKVSSLENESLPPIYFDIPLLADSMPEINRDYLGYLLYKYTVDSTAQTTNSYVKEGSLYEITERDVIVKSSIKHCTISHHKVIDMKAQVLVILPNGKVASDAIAASYCYGCNEYYVLTDDYSRLRGIPLCKVYSTQKHARVKEMKHEYMGFHSQSILFSYGYNVNSDKSLTAVQRRTILSELIARKILSRAEIVSHLNFLLAINHGKSSYVRATKKWIADRDFIDELPSKTDGFIVRSITKK